MTKFQVVRCTQLVELAVEIEKQILFEVATTNLKEQFEMQVDCTYRNEAREAGNG